MQIMKAVVAVVSAADRRVGERGSAYSNVVETFFDFSSLKTKNYSQSRCGYKRIISNELLLEKISAHFSF